ncbi:MAG: hypothetical protein E7536_09935 [Ruminococcaceae bacterium]|nr:hypothetical protein [Oscillospiraceae bacterium]
MKKFLALLTAFAVLFAFAACNKKEENTVTTTGSVVETIPRDAFDNWDEPVQDEVTEQIPEETSVVEVTNAEGETVTNESGEAVTETITQKPVTTQPKDDGPSSWTTAQILDYSNKALDKVKSSKAGYTKHAVMNIYGDVSGIPDVLTKLFQKDETTTMSKGSDNTNDFPAAGYSWSTKLRPEDVASAKIRVTGTTYDILIELGTEKNPGKGTASSYGRAVSVIDAAEAANIIPFGINSVDMTYHDGYIYLQVDSTTGRVTFAEFSAAADAKADLAVIGVVQADSITSTETFTNFVW